MRWIEKDGKPTKYFFQFRETKLRKESYIAIEW